MNKYTVVLIHSSFRKEIAIDADYYEVDIAGGITFFKRTGKPLPCGSSGATLSTQQLEWFGYYEKILSISQLVFISVSKRDT